MSTYKLTLPNGVVIETDDIGGVAKLVGAPSPPTPARPPPARPPPAPVAAFEPPDMETVSTRRAVLMYFEANPSATVTSAGLAAVLGGRTNKLAVCGALAALVLAGACERRALGVYALTANARVMCGRLVGQYSRALAPNGLARARAHLQAIRPKKGYRHTSPETPPEGDGTKAQ